MANPAPGLQLMTNGCSSMGFGVPAAIAAKLCRPDSKVACVTGDGSFLMTAGEMAVARREKLAMVFVVLADESLDLIRLKQDRKDFPRYGTDLYQEPLPDRRVRIRRAGYRGPTTRPATGRPWSRPSGPTDR